MLRCKPVKAQACMWMALVGIGIWASCCEIAANLDGMVVVIHQINCFNLIETKKKCCQIINEMQNDKEFSAKSGAQKSWQFQQRIKYANIYCKNVCVACSFTGKWKLANCQANEESQNETRNTHDASCIRNELNYELLRIEFM